MGWRHALAVVACFGVSACAEPPPSATVVPRHGQSVPRERPAPHDDDDAGFDVERDDGADAGSHDVTDTDAATPAPDAGVMPPPPPVDECFDRAIYLLDGLRRLRRYDVATATATFVDSLSCSLPTDGGGSLAVADSGAAWMIIHRPDLPGAIFTLDVRTATCALALNSMNLHYESIATDVVTGRLFASAFDQRVERTDGSAGFFSLDTTDMSAAGIGWIDGDTRLQVDGRGKVYGLRADPTLTLVELDPSSAEETATIPIHTEGARDEWSFARFGEDAILFGADYATRRTSVYRIHLADRGASFDGFIDGVIIAAAAPPCASAD